MYMKGQRGFDMKITEVIEREPITLSVETFPPKGDFVVEKFREVAAALAGMKPDFMSVTYSAGGTGNSGRTAELSEIAEKDYGLLCMAHLTSINSIPEEVEASIRNMKSRGIENCLALRGDKVEGKNVQNYLSSLDLIRRLKEEGFCVGAAAYPEGHVACESEEIDLRFLKEKQEAGADFFVTQLSFDNPAIFRFLSRARRMGITKSIHIGIMPMMSKAQITRMIFQCGAALPAPMVRLINKYENNEEDLKKAGIEYAADQLLDLCEHGVDGVHIYMMNKPEIGSSLMETLRDAGYCRGGRI